MKLESSGDCASVIVQGVMRCGVGEGEGLDSHRSCHAAQGSAGPVAKASSASNIVFSVVVFRERDAMRGLQVIFMTNACHDQRCPEIAAPSAPRSRRIRTLLCYIRSITAYFCVHFPIWIEGPDALLSPPNGEVSTKLRFTLTITVHLLICNTVSTRQQSYWSAPRFSPPHHSDALPVDMRAKRLERVRCDIVTCD